MQPNRAYRLAELEELPLTKADLAAERADFIEARARAELKGDRALELLRSPECDPWANPVLIALRQAWVRDFEVKA